LVRVPLSPQEAGLVRAAADAFECALGTFAPDAGDRLVATDVDHQGRSGRVGGVGVKDRQVVVDRPRPMVARSNGRVRADVVHARLVAIFGSPFPGEAFPVQALRGWMWCCSHDLRGQDVR
jgi:hypothetical protein